MIIIIIIYYGIILKFNHFYSIKSYLQIDYLEVNSKYLRNKKLVNDFIMNEKWYNNNRIKRSN